MARIGSLVDRRDPPDGPAWDGAEQWKCRCGYVNAGFDRCPSCGGRRSPTDGELPRRPGAVSAVDAWERPAATPTVPRRRPRIDSKVARTVAGVIGLNVVIQAATASLAAQSGAG